MSFGYQFHCIVNQRNIKNTVINLWNNMLCFNNAGDSLQLYPICTHKKETIFLALPPCLLIIFGTCQCKQRPLGKGKLIFLRKCLVRPGAQAEQDTSFFSVRTIPGKILVQAVPSVKSVNSFISHYIA